MFDINNIVEKYLNLLEEGQYKQLFHVIMGVFMIISPSFTYIFIFKRALFLEIDLIKLIILCSSINIMIFFTCFIIISYKVMYEKQLEVYENRENNDSKENETDKLEYIDVIESNGKINSLWKEKIVSQAILETSLLILFMTMIILVAKYYEELWKGKWIVIAIFIIIFLMNFRKIIKYKKFKKKKQ